MKAINSTSIKTVFWLLAFAAFLLLFFSMYWPAIVPTFIAWHFFEKNADKLQELRKDVEI